MAGGGAKPGERRGGRKVGSINKRTLTDIEEARRGGLMPLQYMLQIMRNPKLTRAERSKAAVDAAPYVHGRVTTVNHQGTDGPAVRVVITGADKKLL